MTNKTIQRPPARRRVRPGARDTSHQYKKSTVVERKQRTASLRGGKVKNNRVLADKKPEKPKPKRGTSSFRQGAWQFILALHGLQIMESWKRLWNTPVSSFFTILVLGLVLALPAIFHISLGNFEAVMSGWQTSDRISVFMQRDVPEETIYKIKKRLEAHVNIASASYISPEKGLKEFKERSGLTHLINAMEMNPLPAVLEVIPVKKLPPENMGRLIKQLTRFRGVDSVKQDEIWVRRLHAFIDFGRKITWTLAAVLGITVFLTIGNTIRLLVINRQEEIRVVRLVGGSRGYVMLPFIYSGMWYGLLSSAIACGVSMLLFMLMKDSVSELLSLYHSVFQPKFLNLAEMGIMVGMAIFISVMGAFMASRRQLKKLDTFER